MMKSNTQVIAQRHKYSVVLIDDDEDDQLLFAQEFSNVSMDLTTFNSGWDAINYLHTLPGMDLPSLIVIDYQMPGWNGADVLIRLKQSEKLGHIPVIVFSSDMNEQLRSELLSLGALRCFEKGADARELKEYMTILNVVFTNSFFN